MLLASYLLSSQVDTKVADLKTAIPPSAFLSEPGDRRRHFHSQLEQIGPIVDELHARKDHHGIPFSTSHREITIDDKSTHEHIVLQREPVSQGELLDTIGQIKVNHGLPRVLVIPQTEDSTAEQLIPRHIHGLDNLLAAVGFEYVMLQPTEEGEASYYRVADINKETREPVES